MQSGAVLLVSLVILLVISMLGIANMQSSTNELKMASSQYDRSVAFAAAEAALLAAEDRLELNTPSRAQQYNTCGGSGACFNTSCSEGLCFEGTFTDIEDEKLYCTVGPSGTTQPIEFWSDSSLDVWNDVGKHQTVSIEDFDTDIKYIVEFLCFIPVEDDLAFAVENYKSIHPLYRITALAEGNGDRANVMLQSTYLLVE